jgi:hypothetical protein
MNSMFTLFLLFSIVLPKVAFDINLKKSFSNSLAARFLNRSVSVGHWLGPKRSPILAYVRKVFTHSQKSTNQNLRHAKST